MKTILILKFAFFAGNCLKYRQKEAYMKFRSTKQRFVKNTVATNLNTTFFGQDLKKRL